MITEEQVQNNLKHLLAKAANVRLADISGQETLDMLGIDSAGIISLAAHIEDQFGVMIDAQDIVGNVTIADVSRLIAQRANKS